MRSSPSRAALALCALTTALGATEALSQSVDHGADSLPERVGARSGWAVGSGRLSTRESPRVQSEPRSGFDVGVSVGFFTDYPTHFAPQHCEQKAGAGGGRIGRRLTSILALEASAVVTFGVGDVVCIFPSSPAPVDGGSFNRTVFEDGIVGQSFTATTLAAVVRPPSDSPLVPRLRVGAGRIWDKGLWTWLYGGGLHLRFGSNSVTVDVERWHLGYDLNLELWTYRDSGEHEFQRVDVLPQRPRPTFFRIGWERRIG